MPADPLTFPTGPNARPDRRGDRICRHSPHSASDKYDPDFALPCQGKNFAPSFRNQFPGAEPVDLPRMQAAGLLGSWLFKRYASASTS